MAMELRIELLSGWMVDTVDGGQTFVDGDLLGLHRDVVGPTVDKLIPFCESMPVEVSDGFAEAEWVTGWFHRLSMPGYLDCTEWAGPYESYSEAKAEADMWEGED